MSKEQLRFPSGRTVERVKQEAKKYKSTYSSNTEALNAMAAKHGIDLPWDKAISHLKVYWDAWFSVHIYQAEGDYSVDVRCKGFKLDCDAVSYSKSFKGHLVWLGGDSPLAIVDPVTEAVTLLNNYDVRLWKIKTSSQGSITISEGDLERVYTPIMDWPKLFNKSIPSFAPLAWRVEYGDDDGTHIDKNAVSETEERTRDMRTLDKMGIKIRGEQAGGDIVQIINSQDVLETNYYLITKCTIQDIKAIIATMYELHVSGDFLPHYHNGLEIITAHFVASVLEKCFDQTVLKSERFNFSDFKDTDGDINVTVVNISDITDDFYLSEYDKKKYMGHLRKNHSFILPAYRASLGLPLDINEDHWMIVNVNQKAIVRDGLPLIVKGLNIHDAWTTRHTLEHAAIDVIPIEEGLPREFRIIEGSDLCFNDFSKWCAIYDASSTCGWKHNYPVYRVKHRDFTFNSN
jgi:hypothetical protein